MSKRALIYARVSYDDRKNEARNLEGQIEEGRAYCQEKGYRIVKELAEDDRGASGYDWDLPKLSQALDMARENGFDVFVTRELDRFARNLAKQLVIESEFKRYGVDVEYILAEYDDTPEGRLNKHIRATIAEFEREKINQRMTRGRRRKVKAGYVLTHGKVAYGYREGTVNGKVTLVICEEEAKVVKLIFVWYTVGDGVNGPLTMGEIARRLRGTPTPGDVKGYGKTRAWGSWGVPTISLILSNETYTGQWCYAGDSDLTVEVPAIIDRETWDKAQERKRHNKEMSRRNMRYQYLLAKRVVCGECAKKMSGRSRNNGNGRVYLYYKCRSRELWECDCEMTTAFRADQVDAAVWEKVKEWLQDPEVLQESLEKVKAKLSQKSKPLLDRLSVVDDLLAENRQRLERLLDLYPTGDFPKEVLTDRKARLETTITSLEKERVDLVMTLESQNLSDEQIKTIVDFARKVSKGLEIADKDFNARRRIIDDLDVQVRLVIEDGLKVAYVRWLVGKEERVSIESDSTNTTIWTKNIRLVPGG
jgi:site-specific DNA recombinase